MPNITIADAVQKKYLLERKLFALVQDYELETGLSVSSVDLTHLHLQTISRGEPIIVDVSVQVKVY